MAHTPGELLKDYKDIATPGLLVSRQGKMLLGQVNNEADFKRIVKCWNLHDELVKTLEAVLHWVEPCQVCGGTGYETDDDGSACYYCGGYGETEGGDIMEELIKARTMLDKMKGE